MAVEGKEGPTTLRLKNLVRGRFRSALWPSEAAVREASPTTAWKRHATHVRCSSTRWERGKQSRCIETRGHRMTLRIDSHLTDRP